MDRLGVCVVGVCCVGFGLFAGLAISTAYTPTPEDVVAERDRLRVKCDKLADEVDTERRHKEAARADVDRAFSEVVAADRTIRITKKSHQRVVDKWMKANALLRMIIDDRKGYVLNMLRHRDFRDKFEADWYRPDLAFDELGGQWLFDEIDKCEVVPAAERVGIKAQEKVRDFEESAGNTPEARTQPW